MKVEADTVMASEVKNVIGNMDRITVLGNHYVQDRFSRSFLYPTWLSALLLDEAEKT